MVTCPRCQQPVDETVRTICPLCFTPLPQANSGAGPPVGASLESPLALAGTPLHAGPTPTVPASPYPPSGMPQPAPPMPQPISAAPNPLLNPGARVSLTGEVIDSGAPPGPAPSYVGGPKASARPGQAGPTARSREPARGLRMDAPEKAAGGNPVGIIVAIVLVLGGGFGGWYYWMHRTNPKDQALAVYKAYLAQDYKTAYSLVALSPETQKKYPNADAFAADRTKTVDTVLASNPLLAKLKASIQESTKAAVATATVGDPVVTGDKADVPTSCQVSFMGRSVKFKGTAHMVNESGIWKLDMTSGEAQNSTALVGRPAL